MAGLIDSNSGLRYGKGLSFEAGLGSDGLTNPPFGTQDDSATFAGTGGLRVSAVVKLRATAVFTGSGNLSAHSP